MGLSGFGTSENLIAQSYLSKMTTVDIGSPRSATTRSMTSFSSLEALAHSPHSTEPAQCPHPPLQGNMASLIWTTLTPSTWASGTCQPLKDRSAWEGLHHAEIWPYTVREATPLQIIQKGKHHNRTSASSATSLKTASLPSSGAEQTHGSLPLSVIMGLSASTQCRPRRNIGFYSDIELIDILIFELIKVVNSI